jgi:GNAT superfamily N-acetyltransferase
MADASTSHLVVRRLPAAEIRERADELAELLIDAVGAGASLEFLAPVHPLDAVGWTLDVADGMGRRRIVLAAEQDGALVGTVQVLRPGRANQPHLAELSRLMVHPRMRGRGVGRALMQAAEAVAAETGASLLTLDTAVDGPGLGLYVDLGWRMAGVVPGYVLAADGQPRDTAFFYKAISRT